MGWIWRDKRGGWARDGGRDKRRGVERKRERGGEGGERETHKGMSERTSESNKTTKSNHSWWPPVLFMREFSDCPDTYCSCGIAGNSVSKIESNARKRLQYASLPANKNVEREKESGKRALSFDATKRRVAARGHQPMTHDEAGQNQTILIAT